MPLGEDYKQDYALGEMFFASDLTDQDMNGVEIVQINAVFKRGVDPERVDALRAFFAKVNRMLTGGRFDAQLEVLIDAYMTRWEPCKPKPACQS